MTCSRESILRLFCVAGNRAGEIKPQAAIFPACTAPVVHKADDGERELVPMSGGIPAAAVWQGTATRDELRDDKCGPQNFGSRRSRRGACTAVTDP
jgi:hypothetical protein